MTFKNKIVQKFWRFSTSFQLGIPIIIALATLIAWGTFVEAYYNDAGMARKIVYDSWMMMLTMGGRSRRAESDRDDVRAMLSTCAARRSRRAAK